VTTVPHGWDFGLIAFIAAAALAVFAVVRGLWRVARGTVELDAGGSWGGQLSGSKRTVLVNAATGRARRRNRCRGRLVVLNRLD
jgi:hypothetical protein